MEKKIPDKEIVILREATMPPQEFHYSLQPWQLTKEAWLNRRNIDYKGPSDEGKSILRMR